MKLIVGKRYKCQFTGMEPFEAVFGYENDYGLLVFECIGSVKSGIQVPNGYGVVADIRTGEIPYLIVSKDMLGSVVTD